MNKTFKNLTLIACMCVGMGLAPATYSADRETYYLQDLRDEVDTRLTAEDLSRQQKGALTAAKNILKREGKNELADVKQLAAASKALGRAYAEDEALLGLEQSTLANYAGLVETQIGNLRENAPTNGMPAAFDKLLTQASDALATATGDGDFASRARALSQAQAKVRAAQVLYTRFVKAPFITAEGEQIVLSQRGVGDFVLASNGSYSNGEGEGAETGSWAYERTGPKTATVTLTPTGGEARTYNLTFRTSTSGSFSTDGGRGTFEISQEPVVTAL